jgi:endonuclease YncB( thermonuclease family)
MVFSCDDVHMAIGAGQQHKLWKRRRLSALFVVVLAAVTATSSRAAPCAFADQGEGRVTEVIDGRSIRLDDGREIRLAGIELATPDRQVLSGLIAGRAVVLRSDDDAPDRYGRQSAFVTLAETDTLVQRELLAQGAALASFDVADKDCAGVLLAAEAEAHVAQRGIWSSPVIKNAESPDHILSGIGRFAVVEGKVLSVREAGATTYLNFGRNWTRGFAVTIPRRVVPALEAAGLVVKSLENRRIRVRGWVESRGGTTPGPRIEVIRLAQIEVLSNN